jgi:hypothetical protein
VHCLDGGFTPIKNIKFDVGALSGVKTGSTVTITVA